MNRRRSQFFEQVKSGKLTHEQAKEEINEVRRETPERKRSMKISLRD